MFTVVRLVRPVRSVGGSRTDVRRRRRSVCRAGQLDFKHKDICQRITGAGTASGSRADGLHASAGSFQSGPRQGGRGVGGRRAPLAFVWLALFVLPYTATRSAAVNRFFKLVRPCQLGCRLRHRVFNRVSRPRASWSGTAVCYRELVDERHTVRGLQHCVRGNTLNTARDRQRTASSFVANRPTMQLIHAAADPLLCIKRYSDPSFCPSVCLSRGAAA